MSRFAVCVAVGLWLSSAQSVAKNNGQFLTKNRLYHSVKRVIDNNIVAKVSKDHALWQKLMFGAGLVITCFGASCSSTIDRGSWQQVQLSQADLVGQHIHAIVDGLSYLGYVSRLNSSNELVVAAYSGEELVVSVAEVSGTIYQEHDDLGKSVWLSPLDDDNELVVARHGLVVSVYSDGYYHVMVGAWLDAFGDLNILDGQYGFVVHVNDLQFLDDKDAFFAIKR